MLLRLWEGRADSKGPSVDSDSHFGPSVRPRSISQNSAGPASCLFLPHHRQTGQGTDHGKKPLDPQRLELPLPPLAQTQIFGSVVGLGRSRPQLHQHREGTGEKRMGREPETGTPLSTHTSTCFPMLRH